MKLQVDIVEARHCRTRLGCFVTGQWETVDAYDTLVRLFSGCVAMSQLSEVVL